MRPVPIGQRQGLPCHAVAYNRARLSKRQLSYGARAHRGQIGRGIGEPFERSVELREAERFRQVVSDVQLAKVERFSRCRRSAHGDDMGDGRQTACRLRHLDTATIRQFDIEQDQIGLCFQRAESAFNR